MSHWKNTTSDYHLELVLDAKSTLGEGAIWDSRKKLLYWVDIMQCLVHIYDPATGQNRSIQVGHYVGTVVPRHNGELMLALKEGFASLNPETGVVTLITNPEAHLPGNRFNDGKCDPAGRFWAGTMSLKQEEGAGSLYCFNRDLTVQKMIEGVTISNGLVWTADAATFYYIDTSTSQVSAFNYDKASGKITGRRVAVSIPEKEGFPDGMTIDSEGMLWIAHYGGGQVCRWNPETGEKLFSVKLPASKVTSCAFGGDKLDVLYITTCRENMEEEQVQKEPLAGALFKCTGLQVKGVPAFEFQG